MTAFRSLPAVMSVRCSGGSLRKVWRKQRKIKKSVRVWMRLIQLSNRTDINEKLDSASYTAVNLTRGPQNLQRLSFFFFFAEYGIPYNSLAPFGWSEARLEPRPSDFLFSSFFRPSLSIFR